MIISFNSRILNDRLNMIPETELILNEDGSVYHLNLLPEELAEAVIFVGDPDRVDRVASRFDQIELTKSKREFRTITGQFRGQRVTVISTGIGTDNIDIVLNELDALVNIDFRTRTIKERLTSLKILRLGTCGGLQKELAPGTLVLSGAAVGLDGLMPFYVTNQPGISGLVGTARKALGEYPEIASLIYGARASAGLLRHADDHFPDIHQGITFTAAGFYGPQGRSLGRVGVAVRGLPDLMSTVTFEGARMVNMEMETSGILGLGAALGHECGSFSVILANRHTLEFHPAPSKAVDELIDTGLELLISWLER